MRLEGVTVALITPFDSKGDVNFEALKTLIFKLLEDGYDSFFVNSSTGEVTKLTVEERVEVARRVLDVVPSSSKVIAGTGTGDHRSTIEIVGRYKDVGVSAVLITPPYYIQYDWAGILAFYKRVLERIDVPTILYTIPLTVGYNIPVEVFELVAGEFSQVVGVKDSSGDFRYHMELIHLLGDRIQVLQGLDLFFVPSLIVGAHGGILAGPNFLRRIPLEEYRLVKEGRIEEAVRIHKRLVELWRFMGGCGLVGRVGGKFPTVYKVATQLVHGIDVGSPREPTPPLEEKEVEVLKGILRSLNLIQ